MDNISIKANFLSRLRNTEHFDLMESIIAKMEPSVAAMELVAPLWKQFTDCFHEEAKQFGQQRKQEETDLVIRLKQQRTGSVRRLRQSINFARYSKVAGEKEASLRLRPVVRLYRQATYLSYVEDSAVITAFLKDLRSETYQGAIEALMLQELVEEAWL